MPLQGNGLCTAGHRLNSVHYFCQRFIGADLSPRHRELIPKPGPLPFGELTRANFDQLDRMSQVALAFEVFSNLAIAERLHGHVVSGKSAFQKLLGFSDESASEHGFHSLSDPCLEIFVCARESHQGSGAISSISSAGLKTVLQ